MRLRRTLLYLGLLLLLAGGPRRTSAQLMRLLSDSLTQDYVRNESWKQVPDASVFMEPYYHTGCLWLLYEATHRPDLRDRAAKQTTAQYRKSSTAVVDDQLHLYVFVLGNAWRSTGDSTYRQQADSLLQLIQTPMTGRQLYPDTVKQKLVMTVMPAQLPLLSSLYRNTDPLPGLNDYVLDYALTLASCFVQKDQTVQQEGWPGPRDSLGNRTVKFLTARKDTAARTLDQVSLVYGLAAMYHHTGRMVFLSTAEEVADACVRRLSQQGRLMQYSRPDAVQQYDPVSTALLASALLELAGQTQDVNRARIYKAQVRKMLASLHEDDLSASAATARFRVGYYYLEALHRLKRIEEGESIYSK